MEPVIVSIVVIAVCGRLGALMDKVANESIPTSQRIPVQDMRKAYKEFPPGFVPDPPSWRDEL